MHTSCVHHEEPLFLDITPNPNSFSRLFPILLDPKSFQTVLRFYHMTSRSRAYLLSLFRCRLIIIILNPNLSPSLSTLSYYNILWRNIRSITELASLLVSEYLVGVGLVSINKSKLNESAKIIRSSLIDKWWGKDGSHSLFLILKSPVIIRRLLMLISVSLRYFKAKWEESE